MKMLLFSGVCLLSVSVGTWALQATHQINTAIPTMYIVGGMASAIVMLAGYIAYQQKIMNKIQETHNENNQKVIEKCTEAITKNTNQTELMNSFLKEKLA